MGTVRAIRGSSIPAGPTTGGVTRTVTQVDERIVLGEARIAPQTMSGWHHHGDHTSCVYVVQGRLRIEWGPDGRESIDLAKGDFYIIEPNTIHREGNPGSEEQILTATHLGTGPIVVNVNAPESAQQFTSTTA